MRIFISVTRSRAVVWGIVSILLVALMGCSSMPAQSPDDQNRAEIQDQPLITIGSKSFTTEQILYGKLTALYLRKQGFRVKEMVFKDSQPIRKALESGVIDLYWEYTNTARIFYHHQPPIQDAEEAYRTVAREDRKKGLIWLQPSPFDSPWVVLMREELSEKLAIHTLSQLAAYSKQPNVELKAATYAEFLQRQDGRARLDAVYDIAIKNENWLQTDNALVFQALKESHVDVAVGIAFDGRIRDYHLVMLADDLHAFPPYEAAPVIRESVLAAHPSLETLLNRLSQKLTGEKFAELTYQVDALHKDVAQVANEFLVQEGFIQRFDR